ncbi:hypothetical protein IUY40_18470 [Flavobacterium sp. ALJ2]|uniref:hypothetical protein n=1 Tax=Flavobacterium sp. ALJ2 TaxID=2786960 RepID=UPI00189FDA82|nr:hypothetical protein [Flavobacterium sp. ALJ2]MBF7093521.1 hypothetical protein [Flavobacterium sp. ALJ2]
MKLYTLKANFGTYINRIQSVDPVDNLPFSGGNYNEDENFTEQASPIFGCMINKLAMKF